MARILPDEPLGLVTPEVLRVFRLCRELPDGWVVWQRLDPKGEVAAAFWIVREADWSGIVLTVSSASRAQAQGPGLFEAGQAPFAAVETAAQESLRAQLGTGPELPFLLVFPAVDEAHLRLHPGLPPHAGAESCRPRHFQSLVERHLGAAGSPDSLQAVRMRFCPETVIPDGHTVKPREEGSLVPSLLTYRQEELLKTDLDLSPQGNRTAGEFGLLLVNGVAGSGKSLILLHRALLLQRFFPKGRILVLTCNKPLQMELRRRFAQLGGNELRATWSTFHAFCLRHWPGEAPKVSDRAARTAVRAVLDLGLTEFVKDGLERRHLEEEFAWIFDQGFADLEAYHAHPRKGRGFRCGERLRERLWRAAGRYRAELEERGLSDWSLLGRQLSDLYAVEGARVPQYDAVLVDEAQFFAPSWFEVIRKVLAPTGRLFLVADPTQGFLQRGGSWKSQGLSVHGRTRRLERSHRTTRTILESAWRFWHARTRREDPDVVVPRTEGMPEGVAPRLVRFETPRDELSWVVGEATGFVKSGGEPGHLLLLHEDWQAAQELVERLRGALGEERACHAKEGATGAVRVCTLNAATGLESPVTIVSGTHLLFGREGALLSDAEARETAAQETTRKLYMAFTRAGQRLVVTHVGTPPKSLLAAFP
jgi:superfamily I DNA/RNA helicase